jgi:hypothetical protein
MDLTFLAMVASLMMGLGAACLFIYAVWKNWLHDIEDAKYQVFWSDLEKPVDSSKEKVTDGNGDETGHKN